MQDLSSWLALRATKGLGPGTLSRLVFRFGSAQAVQAASVEDLVEAGGVTQTVAERIRQPPDAETLSAIEHEIEAIAHGPYSVITVLDGRYPDRLKKISDPPPLLYVSGQLAEADSQAIAIVGARSATHTGVAFTRALCQELASIGFTIVSGLARGIDRAAHEGALACASGRTVAVLGCGIDRTYPAEHKQLRAGVEDQGAVLSEFPIGSMPYGHHFPQRNRVISGMSLGVIVTEAAEQSGSLITARFALEQNREVFAVPGAVTNELSRGPHRLIKQGAKLVEHVDDVLEELLPQLSPSVTDRLNRCGSPACEQPSVLDEKETMLYNCISLEPIALEDLISRGNCPPSEVMSLLLSLEMKGAIRQLAGSQYIRTSVP